MATKIYSDCEKTSSNSSDLLPVGFPQSHTEIDVRKFNLVSSDRHLDLDQLLRMHFAENGNKVSNDGTAKYS